MVSSMDPTVTHVIHYLSGTLKGNLGFQLKSKLTYSYSKTSCITTQSSCDGSFPMLSFVFQ